MSRAYYNEVEPYAAQWLRNQIDEKLIPAGDVDTRSIKDVQAADLNGYRQCHFFAGIGGWALAARFAGWPDDRELWTGSAPCQPFSVAGKQAGTSDDRHLWPDFFRLIRACRPAVVMGEQVAAAVGKNWLDGVFTDLEGIAYAGRAVIVPACAVNAPHRRDRLWFVARSGAVGDGERERLEGLSGNDSEACRWQIENRSAPEAGSSGDVADLHLFGSREGRLQRSGEFSGAGSDPGDCLTCGEYWDDCDCVLPGPFSGDVADRDGISGREGCAIDGWRDAGSRAVERPGPRSNVGVWHDFAWVVGHDGKARRVEPSIHPLAHGIPARVGRLRAYGNAIVPQVAEEVIAAFMDCMPSP